MAEFVSWEISVSVSNLEEEQNNQLKKEIKKSFKRLFAPRGRLQSPGSPSHRGMARMDFVLEWIRHSARPRALHQALLGPPTSHPAIPTTGQSHEPPWAPSASQGKLGHCVPQFPPFGREEALGVSCSAQDRGMDAASPCHRAGDPQPMQHKDREQLFPSTGTCSAAPRALQELGCPRLFPSLGRYALCSLFYLIFF